MFRSFGAPTLAIGLVVAAAACSEPTAEEIHDPGLLDAVQVGEQLRLASDTAVPGDMFGAEVAISGNTVLVGAPAQNAVKVVVRDGDAWTLQGDLVPDDEDHRVSYKLAVDGDTAVVAVYERSTDSTLAYVFARSGETWEIEAKLRGTESVARDYFGSAIAIDGDRIAIAAQYADDRQGAVYVFERGVLGWAQTARLRASNGQPLDQLGTALALEGDTLLVGAPDSHRGYGSAYVFTHDGTGWIEEGSLWDPDGTFRDSLGFSLALSGDVAVLSAHGRNEARGVVLTFRREGSEWTKAELIEPPQDAPGMARFGTAVAVSGDLVLISATPFDYREPGVVYAFVHRDQTWIQETRIVATDSEGGDSFGRNIRISGTTAVIATEPDTRYDPKPGRAYVMQVARDRDDDDTIDATDNCIDVANADQADLDGDGAGDLCDDDDDGDAIADLDDNCRTLANPEQRNIDGDGFGDACDDDDDGDGLADPDDNCPKIDNPEQDDEDENGVGDACEDSDGDGINLLHDNCPDDANPSQQDEDGNGVGDVCDDGDEDGLFGLTDNCPAAHNPDQADLDGDGVGDACDSDFDGDGVLNEDDICPRTANPDQDDVCNSPYGCSMSGRPSAPAALLLLIFALRFRPRRRRA